jgi:dipeptidyl aminopeptidase/acylaminoacyl peptidase
MTFADGTGEPVEIGPGGWCDLSPDDRTLIYCLHRADGDDWDLVSLPLGEDGLPSGEPVSFLDTEGIAWEPRFSPDGGFVAYHSDESGATEIYLKTFPAGPGKWQISAGGGYWPHWSPDGREITYVRNRTEIVSVPVELSPTVRLGATTLLFSRPQDLGSLPLGWPDSYAVAPDGRFLIGIPPEDAAEVQERGLEIVQNWYAEFAKR